MADTVVLLSGGLDSTVLLASVIAEKQKPVALGVRYGQRHERELIHAKNVAQALGVDFILADLQKALEPVFAGSQSSQVGQRVPVPTGHYADESMKQTIVPNRNMVLLSVAGALAVSRNAKAVAYAAHAGDHPIYPDCRPEFMEAVENALVLGSNIALYAPFRAMSKTEIVKRGAELKAPMHLTYSCYAGFPQHCGKCGTCYERREAFRDANVPDPTEYLA